jgi:threonine/homoserine/homoserine lactone efflux protein
MRAIPHKSNGTLGPAIAITLSMSIESIVLLAGAAFLLWMLFEFFEWRARTLRSATRRKRGRA